uniref:Uncharacterized protein n=1 Tax=Anopheles atroparvus TaxID=41427 RepID=A0AAG5DT56_ANOAO
MFFLVASLSSNDSLKINFFAQNRFAQFVGLVGLGGRFGRR